jgi:excisionase family DNA binding protein
MRESKAVAKEEKPVRGKLLTIAEAAEKIGLSKKWIYAKMETGTLPFSWFMPSPRKRLIDRADPLINYKTGAPTRGHWRYWCAVTTTAKKTGKTA